MIGQVSSQCTIAAVVDLTHLELPTLEELRNFRQQSLPGDKVAGGLEEAVCRDHPPAGALVFTRDRERDDDDKLTPRRGDLIGSRKRTFGDRDGIEDKVDVPAGELADLLNQGFRLKVAIDDVRCPDRLEKVCVMQGRAGDDGREPGQACELDRCGDDTTSVTASPR